MTAAMDIQALLFDDATLKPLLLSGKIILASSLLHLLISVPLACWLARKKGGITVLVDTLVTLPLIFPPVAMGFGLLLFFGRYGYFSKVFGDVVVFNFPGLVIAAFIAGLPLAVRPVQAVLRSAEAVRLYELAVLLGKRDITIFSCILLPYAKRSIAAGMILATGRALGEVGMTLMLGGNIMGRTNTLSLEIYNAVFNGEFERAAFLSILVGVIATVLFLLMKKLSNS